MSTFLKKIAELTIGPVDKEKEAEKARIANAKQKVKDGTATDQERELADADTNLNKSLTQKIKKSQQKVTSEAGPGDLTPPIGGAPAGIPPVPAGPAGIPPVPAAPPPPPPEPDPLTTEGETFLINLARKALFVDIDDVGLSDIERESITKEAEPENAKKVAKILRKIIVDYGLSESFHSKADVLLEDLKKNGRVVVLVPGSFKPPHKGHFEMVRSYSESWPQGQVHVLISAPSARSERRTKDGRIITPDAALQIFELYVRPLNNVTVSVSEHPSPVTAAYESLKTLEPGTTVVLGASKKDNDWKRWSYAQSWTEKGGLGLNILDPAETAVDVTTNATGEPYSAGNIRDNFDNFEMIQHDIPDHVDPEQIKQVFDSL